MSQCRRRLAQLAIASNLTTTGVGREFLEDQDVRTVSSFEQLSLSKFQALLPADAGFAVRLGYDNDKVAYAKICADQPECETMGLIPGSPNTDDPKCNDGDVTAEAEAKKKARARAIESAALHMFVTITAATKDPTKFGLDKGAVASRNENVQAGSASAPEDFSGQIIVPEDPVRVAGSYWGIVDWHEGRPRLVVVVASDTVLFEPSSGDADLKSLMAKDNLSRLANAAGDDVSCDVLNAQGTSETDAKVVKVDMKLGKVGDQDVWIAFKVKTINAIAGTVPVVAGERAVAFRDADGKLTAYIVLDANNKAWVSGKLEDIQKWLTDTSGVAGKLSTDPARAAVGNTFTTQTNCKLVLGEVFADLHAVDWDCEKLPA